MIKEQEIITQNVKTSLKEAKERYVQLSIKYHDCISFTEDEEIEWKEVCQIVLDDLKITDPNMFIDIKKSNKEKYELYRKNQTRN